MTAECSCACCVRQRRLRVHAEVLTTALLSAEHRAFIDTGNGMHAWIAYRRTRQARGAMPPAWVLEYFDHCYERLKAGTSSSKAIAAALHLDTRGGGRTARERAITRRQHVAVTQEVGRRIAQKESGSGRRANAAQREVIFADVGNAVGLSTDRVRNIVNELSPPVVRKRPTKNTANSKG